MSMPERVKTKMKEEGLSGVNKPKKTPSHPKKSHAVMAKEGDTYKFIRFGQQGVRGAGKNPITAKDKARKKSYYARHNAQGKPTSKFFIHRMTWVTFMIITFVFVVRIHFFLCHFVSHSCMFPLPFNFM